jgi:subtilase family serine protease
MIEMPMHSYLKKLDVARQASPWRVPQLCASYGWPTNLSGGGIIGIIELGGGWVWNDVGRFCGSLGLSVPKIGDFSVDGSMNNGDVSDPASGEVALDIQVSLAAYSVATGNKPATIRVYWAGNTINAIAQGIAKAAADSCDTISISWGSDEANWGNVAAKQLEAAATVAVGSGAIIFAAAGDNNSSDGGATPANVDLPASAPHVIGCGGTKRPQGSSPANPETVWNENPGNADGEGTGGGFSTIFPVSPWMAGAPTGPGRMVPDVTANADPSTGYHVTLGGQDVVFGGTSAVAPLYAGLFAAFGRKLGFVAPKLWADQLAFNDITVGDNGKYRALVGPDPCSGLGSPRAAKLATLFGN